MYECHITIISNEPDKLKERIEKQYCWHFSRIDGDPDLGVGVKCYATKHYSVKLQSAISLLEGEANSLKKEGYDVIRCKVEEVLYDRRM